MKLTIGHLYPDLLNLYGDRGNIQPVMQPEHLQVDQKGMHQADRELP